MPYVANLNASQAMYQNLWGTDQYIGYHYY